MAGGWWQVAGCWWLVAGGWRLVAGGNREGEGDKSSGAMESDLAKRAAEASTIVRFGDKQHRELTQVRDELVP